MHIVNLDLLRAAATHRPDGQPKDPHAHHRAEHLAERRSARRARWGAVLGNLLTRFHAAGAKHAAPVQAKATCP